MKVSNVGSSKGVSAAKRKSRTGGAAFAEELQAAQGPSGVSQVSETQAVAAVGSILAAQEVPDSMAGRSKGLALRYGEDMLDRLEDIRRDLLTGAISKDKLADLARTMRAQKQRTEDPRLNEVIEEIELRAEVEIAKLTRTV